MLIIFAIPLFVILILIEYLLARKKQQIIQNVGDTVNNLNIGIGNQVVGLLYKGIVLGVFIWIYNTIAFFHLPINVWTILLVLFIYDFLFYWAHRLSHEVNILWAAHSVHHQSDEYNLSVALRQSWIHNLLAFAIFLPLPLLGFDPLLLGAVSFFATIYQFWIHTKLINKLPKWIEFFMNTPSHHRVHHAVNEEYLDKNHGAVFIIWDRLFNTFQEEVEEPVYGITNQFKSLNPLYANYAYFVELFQQMTNYKYLDKLRLFFKYPGWAPGASEKEIPVVDLNRPKFQIEAPKGFVIYAILQFVVIAWATMSYISHFEEFSMLLKIGFAVLIILSTVICSGFLENKKWVYFAEFARLPLVFFILNSYYFFMYVDWFGVMMVTSLILFAFFTLWFGISVKKNYKMLLS